MVSSRLCVNGMALAEGRAFSKAYFAVPVAPKPRSRSATAAAAAAAAAVTSLNSKLLPQTPHLILSLFIAHGIPTATLPS